LARRILTIILAIVLAMIGTGAVLIYVKRADQRAIAGQKAVSVLVATRQVPAGTLAGTALREGLLTEQKLPAESVPADAVSSIGPDLSGLALSSALPSGALLLRPMLVTKVEAATGLAIPAGKVAITVQMCLQKAVAGFVKPGSEIAVFNTFFKGATSDVNWSCAGTTWEAGATDIHTRLVLANVPVLAVGQASASTNTPTTSTGVFTSSGANSSSSDTTVLLITVAVNQSDAERLIHLAEAGIPYMALVDAGSNAKPDVTFKP